MVCGAELQLMALAGATSVIIVVMGIFIVSTNRTPKKKNEPAKTT